MRTSARSDGTDLSVRRKEGQHPGRLQVDRLCRVRLHLDGSCWIWHCAVCTSAVRPFTGTAASWQQAYAAADSHIRKVHHRGDDR